MGRGEALPMMPERYCTGCRRRESSLQRGQACCPDGTFRTVDEILDELDAAINRSVLLEEFLQQCGFQGVPRKRMVQCAEEVKP